MKAGSGRTAGASPLARAFGLETLEAAYEAWREVELAHVAEAERLADERRRLSQQGDFLVGTVRAAAGPVAPAPKGRVLARRGGELGAFLKQAEAQLDSARAALELRAAKADAAYAQAAATATAAIRERAGRFLERVRPRLSLAVRPLGPSRFVLHVARVKPDEAVLLLVLFTGRIPSRYDFLFDDSTDDVLLPPPALYPDAGVPGDAVRPGPKALADRVRDGGDVLPVKGHLPVFVPGSAGAPVFYRLLQRGPVMEVEIADGDAFRNALTKEEAEAFSGHLLRLKLEGRVDLELEAG